jgi:hypothetical protein
VTLLWGDSLALYVGAASPGAQAPYFPPPSEEPGRHRIEIVSTRRIVPSEGIPADVHVRRANNNLDVVRHQGRVYLAFRTAPDHFASRDTSIEVVSSEDERTWRHETKLAVGTDLREPRFLSLGDSLFLYTSKLGSNRFAFEPAGVFATERRSDGSWTTLEDAGLPGRILWRARVVQDRAYATAYLGGANMYSFTNDPISIELLTTTDGRHWVPSDPGRRIVYVGGGSETDFALSASGAIHAVVRNEEGDDSGFGALLCGAPHLGAAWSCLSDKRKYDSPYVFEYDGETYVLARRNVTSTGAYDVGWGPAIFHRVLNELEYITAGKRCSLWRFADGGTRLAFVLDLPSRGDTCFPSVLAGPTEGTQIVYDYSSDIYGPDVAWSVGQRGATYVYRHELRFTRR